MEKLQDVLEAQSKKQDSSVWWYLTGNIEPKVCGYNLAKKRERWSSITIYFGQGNSGHTWRDFRWLINGIIQPLMLREKTHRFLLKDEGMDGLFYEDVSFKKGMS